MKDSKPQFKLLVHCTISQIREGFKNNLRSLPFSIEADYADLSKEGLCNKLKTRPNLIVVLLNEGDSDFLLPLKLKLFAADISLLVITPNVPDRYLHFLKTIGVEKIIVLPSEQDAIFTTIRSILQPNE